MATVWITEFASLGFDTQGKAMISPLLPSKRTTVLDIGAGAALATNPIGDDATIIHLISDVAFHFRVTRAASPTLATVADKVLEPGVVHEFAVQAGNPQGFKFSAIAATVTLGGSGGGGTSGGALETTQGNVYAMLQDIDSLLGTPANFLPPTPLLVSSGLTHFRLSSAAANTYSIVAAATGQTVRVHGLDLSVASDATGHMFVDICSNTTILRRYKWTAGQGLFTGYDSRPLFKSAAGETINIITSGTLALEGRASFVQSA